MMSFVIGLTVIMVIIFIAIFTRKRNDAEVSASVAAEMIKDPQVIILDVRTPNEFAQGHIEGARLIPVAELRQKISQLQEFKNSGILIYCLRGRRSGAAYQILKENGFMNLRNLKGGIAAWTQAGKKLVA